MSTLTGKPSRKAIVRKGGTKRAAQSQRTSRTRAQILVAASDVFGRLGYMDTRVEDILAQSGVSRPTFYRFFQNKEDVFDALDEQYAVTLMKTITSAVSKATDPNARLDLAVEAFLRCLGTLGPLALTLNEQSQRADSTLASRREATIQALTQWFANENEQISGRQYDPVLFRALVGVVELVGVRLMRETPRLTEKQIERGRRIALRIVRATLASPQDLALPPIPMLPKT